MKSGRYVLLVTVAGLAVVYASGCAMFECRTMHSYPFALGDGRTLVISHLEQANMWLIGSERNCAVLQVYVQNDEEYVGGEIARKQTKSFGDGFELGELEARSDECGRHLWIIERPARRVVATFDLLTWKRTGPNEPPPPWATLDGGRVLPAEES